MIEAFCLLPAESILSKRVGDLINCPHQSKSKLENRELIDTLLLNQIINNSLATAVSTEANEMKILFLTFNRAYSFKLCNLQRDQV